MCVMIENDVLYVWLFLVKVDSCSFFNGFLVNIYLLFN